MKQVMTVTDYLLYELNRRARARGDDVELVWQLPEQPEHPKPQLATDGGNVVQLNPNQKGELPHG
jgi:hypothetical protein